MIASLMPASPPTVADVAAFLERFAPLSLAESWDNVGLLAGDGVGEVRRIMTCLTLSEDVAREAAERQVSLVVSHHPLMFKAIKRITSESAEGRTLLTLLRAGVSVYSPHTAFDSAALGINQRLAESLGLTDIVALRPAADIVGAGGARIGELSKPTTLNGFLKTVRQLPHAVGVAFTGELEQPVLKVAVACGAAAEFLVDAANAGCDVLLTGEARFHACLEARALGIALVQAGHYATERPGIEALAGVLAKGFPSADVFASQVETDPVQWMTA